MNNLFSTKGAARQRVIEDILIDSADDVDAIKVPEHLMGSVSGTRKKGLIDIEEALGVILVFKRFPQSHFASKGTSDAGTGEVRSITNSHYTVRMRPILMLATSTR